MKIISISGLDGSGKSTQIEMLKSYLESQGQKIFYFHAIQFGLANILKKQYYKLLHMQRFVVLNNLKEKSVVKANRLQIIGRRIFLLIDLLRFKMLRSKLRNAGYDYILSDRYFYDSAINIKYLAKSDKKLPCDKLISKPELAIYLETSPENIMQRERKPDQGLEYLQTKKILYDKMAPFWNLKVIDGNRLPEEVFSNIKRLV